MAAWHFLFLSLCKSFHFATEKVKEEEKEIKEINQTNKQKDKKMEASLVQGSFFFQKMILNV